MKTLILPWFKRDDILASLNFKSGDIIVDLALAVPVGKTLGLLNWLSGQILTSDFVFGVYNRAADSSPWFSRYPLTKEHFNKIISDLGRSAKTGI